MRWLGVVSLVMALGAGCASRPQPAAVNPAPVEPAPPAPAFEAPAPVQSARQLEPGETKFFGEVIVAVPLEGAHQVYQNLHVGLAANVDPREPSKYEASQVQWLFQRLEPRLDAAVLQVVTDAGVVSPRKLGALHDAIVTRLQSVVSQTVGNWPYTADYQVEVEVVSLYFTDSTVGRGEGGRRGTE